MAAAPMASRTVLVLVLLAGLLAGCTGDPGSPAPASPGDGDTDGATPANGTANASGGPAADANASNVSVQATPTRIRFGGCTQLQGIFLVPAAVAPGLPDGFSHALPGYVGPSGAAATVVVNANVCDNATAGTTNLTDVLEVQMLVLVDPPERYRSSGIDSYAVQVLDVVADEGLHDLYRAWNLSDTELGSLSATMTTDPATRRSEVAFESANASATLRTGAPNRQGIGQSFRSRLFSTSGGEVTAVVDTTVNVSTAWTGAAKLVDDRTPAPGNANAWVFVNALGTGSGSELSVDRVWTYRDPASFEG